MHLTRHATVLLALTGCSESALTFDKTRASAPSCAFSSPMDGATLESASVDLCVVVSDSDAGTVTVEWSTQPPTAVSGDDAVTEDGTACATTMVEPGATTATATVTDPDGLADVCSVTFEVVESEPDPDPEPTPPAVALEPLAPTTIDDLEAVLTQAPEDADGAALDVAYTWSVDGTVQADLTAETVSAARTTRGELWSVEVSASSGADTASTTIENTPPGAPTVLLTPEAPVETLDGLLCSIDTAATDADMDPLTYSVSWTLDGTPWTGAPETTDLTDDTIPVSALDEDQVWTCSILANDGEQDGAPGEASTTVEERRFIRVTSGAFHACAWDDLGRVTCWGDDSDQQVSNTPSDTFVSVDASTRHSCGITDAGAVKCWGVANEQGQVDNTPTSAGWAVVGAAGNNNCAIDTAGALTCWGNDDDGRSNPPSGSDYVEVAGGVSFLCASDSSGSLSCWGEYANGAGADPGQPLVGLSAGNHMCGIRPSDRGALCWGFESDGQTSPPSDAFDVVTAGQKHSCGLRTDGTLTCWGSDYAGESAAPSGTFLDISAGSHIPLEADYFTCGVDTDHELHCWGSDTYGQQSQLPGAR